MKIRAVPPPPPEILEAAKRGELVVFFGAGLSKIIGCPSWDGFAQKYLEELLKHKKINHFEYEKMLQEDPRMVLTICQNIITKEGLRPPNIPQILEGDPDLIKKLRLYEHLYKFNSVFVTTNFDEHMDDVVTKIQRKRISPHPVPDASAGQVQEDAEEKYIYCADEELLLTALKKGSLVHLHGSTQNVNDLIITLPDYIRKYTPESRASYLLKEIFEKRTVLFMGYGVAEYEIIEFLIRKAGIQENVIRHYMLFGAFKEEGNLVDLYGKYYAELGIELVPFSRTIRGYGQLVSVIRSWEKKIGPVAGERSFIKERQTIDEAD